jgi:hypothetical protein
MMDSMRKAFSFEGNMEGAKAAGMESSVRMNIIKERLRRKQAENAAKASTQSVNSGQVGQVPVNTMGPSLSDDQFVEEFASILNGGGKKGSSNKKNAKK